MNNNTQIQQIRLVESVSSSGIGIPSSPRRGSVPADISELRREYLIRNASSAGVTTQNKSRNNRKKSLRRRSSGGPEMFSNPTDDNDNASKCGWKRDFKRDSSSIPEPSVKRRGSLPVEVVSIAHTGRYNFR